MGNVSSLSSSESSSSSVVSSKDEVEELDVDAFSSMDGERSNNKTSGGNLSFLSCCL